MEISANEYNNPVNFYPKNTGNKINMAIESENHTYSTNVFSPEFLQTKPAKIQNPKRKRKSKRLNAIDNEYLPEEIEENAVQQTDNNIFISKNNGKIKNIIKKILIKTPFINYFFLKKKTKKIQETVKSLNNINQNVDELLNTAIPYGETGEIYDNLAKNLTNAANILGKANKDFN